MVNLSGLGALFARRDQIAFFYLKLHDWFGEFFILCIFNEHWNSQKKVYLGFWICLLTISVKVSKVSEGMLFYFILPSYLVTIVVF